MYYAQNFIKEMVYLLDAKIKLIGISKYPQYFLRMFTESRVSRLQSTNQ